MSTKSTPKSCSCGTCRRAKHSKAGHELMKANERGFRHRAKADLKKGIEDFDPAPHGNRIG